MQGGYNEPIKDEAKAAVLGEYMAGCSVNAIATRHSMSWATVKKIIEGNKAEIDTLRTEKRKELIASSLEVMSIYLNRLGDPALVKVTKAKDAAIVYGILADKWQRESELAMTFDVLFDEAFNDISSCLFDCLNESYPGVYDQVRTAIRDIQDDVKEKARAALEEKFKDLKKKVSTRRVMGDREAGQEEYIELDGKKYTRDELLQAVAGASADMQIEIIDMWNAAGKAEKGAQQ